MRVDDVYHEFFLFDKKNTESIPEGRRSAVHAWLLSNPESWRFEDPQISLKIKQQYFAILIGEEGAGKTTELEMYRETLRASNEYLILTVDFTACAHHDFENSMPIYLRKRLEDSIIEADLFMEYRAALLREQLAQPFHAFYELQHAARGNFKNWDDDTLLTDRRVLLGSVLYEKDRPRSASALALRAAQKLSLRPFLLIDNTDLLGRDRVYSIARFVSQELNGDTYVIVTTRPENHVPWVKGVGERRRIQPVDLQSSSQRLFQIADLRLSGAQSYIAHNHPELTAIAIATAERLRPAIQSIADQPSCTRLVTDWHNRSVRQMLPSLIATATACAQRKPNESLHGVVFRTLVAHAMPESLIEIFTPEYPETPGRPPFVFLKLRILAYMYRRREAKYWPLEKIKEDFWDAFHVREADTETAIRDMEEKVDQVAGALLRVEESPTDPGHTVVLLSAGQCMMEEVLTSCDFLSWVYDRSRMVRDVSTEGKTISQAKLDKAVEVVRSHLLPLFAKEHPYMKRGLDYFPSRRPTHDDLVRLTKYRTMFGYYSGHWFIARLSDVLKNYADNRPDRVVDRRALDALVLECERYVANLDSVGQYSDTAI